MTHKPTGDTIPQTADGGGLYRRKLVASMALTLVGGACMVENENGSLTVPLADHVVPATGPVPVVPKSKVPAQPADHSPMLLLVGPGNPYPQITDAGERLVQLWGAHPAAPVHIVISPAPPRHYENDFDTYSRRWSKRPAWPPYHGILQGPVVIEGEPGKVAPDLVTDGYGDGVLYYQKGAWVTGAFDATFRHLNFDGFRRQDGYGNYAAVRIEPAAANAAPHTILFDDVRIGGPMGCDNGLMGGDGITELVIRNSEFLLNGSGTGLTHNIYIGSIAKLILDRVYSHDVRVGHLAKSRALRTIIRNTRLLDRKGSASYCLDVPNGGHLDVDGLVTEKGASASNAASIHFSGESQVFHPSSIRIRNWTMLGVPTNGTPFGGPGGLFNASGQGDAQSGPGSALAVPDIQGTRVFGVDPARLYWAGNFRPLPDAGLVMLAAMPALNTARLRL